MHPIYHDHLPDSTSSGGRHFGHTISRASVTKPISTIYNPVVPCACRAIKKWDTCDPTGIRWCSKFKRRWTSTGKGRTITLGIQKACIFHEPTTAKTAPPLLLPSPHPTHTLPVSCFRTFDSSSVLQTQLFILHYMYICYQAITGRQRVKNNAISKRTIPLVVRGYSVRVEALGVIHIIGKDETSASVTYKQQQTGAVQNEDV
ncbi:hypothetical protein NXS19_001199 [Fusarium pseudograminearum]|nr:hypothetical protein NXS19_001199 [Fusarium pseudograminearum]